MCISVDNFRFTQKLVFPKTMRISTLHSAIYLGLRRCFGTTGVTKGMTSGNELPRTQVLHQGEKASLFSKSEVDNRISKLRTYMEKNGIGACVMTSYHNINYFSGGYHYACWGRNYGLVVTPENVITVSAGVDGGHSWRRSHGDNISYTDWRKDNYFYLIKTLLEGVNGTVGFELDNVSHDNYKIFDNVLPNNKLVDIGSPTQKMRMVKSQEEQAILRQGARIADIGGAAAIGALKNNVAEYEVAIASTNAMIREIACTYPQSELLDTFAYIQSGINTDGAHNPLTSRRIQRGDIISMNCFPMIQGNYAALERIIFLDHASSAHLDVWEKNRKVHLRGIELVKSGIKCSEISRELNEMYREFDLLKYKSIGYGHSMGLMCHYFGREAGLELRDDIDTVLEPNMTISMEPMVTIPEGLPGAGGYRDHDILIVNKEGAENITKFPSGPEHLIIKG